MYSLYLFVMFPKSGAAAPINQPGDVATAQGERWQNEQALFPSSAATYDKLIYSHIIMC